MHAYLTRAAIFPIRPKKSELPRKWSKGANPKIRNQSKGRGNEPRYYLYQRSSRFLHSITIIIITINWLVLNSNQRQYFYSHNWDSFDSGWLRPLPQREYRTTRPRNGKDLPQRPRYSPTPSLERVIPHIMEIRSQYQQRKSMSLLLKRYVSTRLGWD